MQNCSLRDINYHSSCDSYISWKNKWQEIKKKQIAEFLINGDEHIRVGSRFNSNKFWRKYRNRRQ